MPIVLRLSGRTDLEAFFLKSGLYWPNRNAELSWLHYPVLVFVVDQENQEVRHLAFGNALALERIADGVQCLQQWPGRWSSDFFVFTVGDARPYLPHGWIAQAPAPAEAEDEGDDGVPWHVSQ